MQRIIVLGAGVAGLWSTVGAARALDERGIGTNREVCDLFGEPMLPLAIDWYATILDLGPWGAIYIEDWDRRVVAKKVAAKRVKQTINRQRIDPPLSRHRRDTLAAAAPTVRTPPVCAANVA
ncbi:hypothetical protein [Rhodopila sp.]|uniref:hypothetical protein n=1 Tax=Rhodopila sp. TaxID=2480087 RepID=UPI003D0A6692